MPSVVANMPVPGAGVVSDVLSETTSICTQLTDGKDIFHRAHYRITSMYSTLLNVEYEQRLPPAELLLAFARLVGKYRAFIVRYNRYWGIMRRLKKREITEEASAMNTSVDRVERLLATTLSTSDSIEGDTTKQQDTLASIKSLIATLQSGSEMEKNDALAELQKLAVNPANQVDIADAGAFPPLIELVTNGTEVQKANAAKVLWYLATTYQNKAKIADAGGVRPLVGLLIFSTAAQKDNAVRALWELSTHAKIQDTIADAGGIRLLVHLVAQGTALQQEYAAGVLGTIARDEAHHAAIAKAGAINPLSSILVRPASTTEQKEKAVAALWNMSSFENEPAIRKAVSMANLESLKASGTIISKTCAAGLLRNLAAHAATRLASRQPKVESWP